jgi:glycosidase
VETLRGWAQFGIDGYRCDVASLLPLDFWVRAREGVEEVKPGVIWLAESVHASFVAHRRAAGLGALSDGELYQAFDITYDYDIWSAWQAAVRGEEPVAHYLAMLRFQDAIYPENFVKLRAVENHDQARIMTLAPSRAQALAWTAFQAFNKGAFLIYAGQEAGSTHRPTLFEVDAIDWGDYELQPFITLLAHLKKDPALVEGHLTLLADAPAIQAAWEAGERSLYGVFNVKGESGAVEVQLPDGAYADLLSDEMVEVRDGRLALPESAAILRAGQELRLEPFASNLLDYGFPQDAEG